MEMDFMVPLRNIMVPMRDGVRLATDVYLPLARETRQPLESRESREGTGSRRPRESRESGEGTPEETGTGAGQRTAFPVILERTPYDKTAPSRSERTVADPVPKSREEVAAFFVRRGYAVVYQDCRGTHGSEGRFTKYLSEGEDGFDTIGWIARQSWCSGKVGTMGLSYAAHTQVAAACLAPPALAAMFVDSGGFHDAYQGGIRQGGAFELKQATWAMRQAMQSPEATSDPVLAASLAREMEHIAGWFTRMPWTRGQSPLRWLPEFEDYLFDQWERGEYSGFWRKLGICSKAYMDTFADVPMVHMSSWYDPYPRTATNNYLDLSRRKKGPVALILGPWTHGDRCLSHAGDVDFGSSAPLEGNLAASFLELRCAWFDRWLKNPPSASCAASSAEVAAGAWMRTEAEEPEGGAVPEGAAAPTGAGSPEEAQFPAVRYFRMGGGSGGKNAAGRLQHGGTWLTAGDWPPPSMHEHSLYPGTGFRLRETPGDDQSLSWRYDPRNPVPSIGGTITSGEPVMRGGAFDQTEDSRFFGCPHPGLPLASRPDILVFRTEPLAQALEVTGPVRAELWISSDAPDTDFTIKLVDEYPPSPDYPRGFAMNITDGILRTRYREGWDSPRFLQPGEICRIRIEAFPTSNLFCAGHRIRLDISSSNFPHFDANPNSGEGEGSGRLARIAVNTLHTGHSYPSRLILCTS